MNAIRWLAYGEYVTEVQFDNPILDPSQVCFVEEFIEVEFAELNGVIYQGLQQTMGAIR